MNFSEQDLIGEREDHDYTSFPRFVLGSEWPLGEEATASEGRSLPY